MRSVSATPGTPISSRPGDSRRVADCRIFTVRADEVVHPVHGREREVFAQLGKGGDVANSDMEAICRVLSLWLRCNGRLETVLKQLEGIGSSLTVPTKDGRIMSLGDGLAKALQRYLDASGAPVCMATSLGNGLVACLGECSVVVAGGMESMSRAPHAMLMRPGIKMGEARLQDTMLRDALIDPFHSYHMGNTAENVARKYGVEVEKKPPLVAYRETLLKPVFRYLADHGPAAHHLEVAGIQGLVADLDPPCSPVAFHADRGLIFWIKVKGAIGLGNTGQQGCSDLFPAVVGFRLQA